MSGKPKIYQGVRVKITVKELLQQRRAKQAVADEASQVSREGCNSSIPFLGSFSPPCPAPPLEADLLPSSSGCLPPWQFPNSTSCEEIPSYLEQLLDSCLQNNHHLDPSLEAIQGNMSCPSDTFQPGPPSLGQSLSPGSLNSSDFSSSFDYNCSPVQLPPFAPPSYSSPSALDTKSCMYSSPEENPYLQHSHAPYNPALSTCVCTSCGSQHLDAYRGPEYFAYANTGCRDYAPSVADDFFQRDRSWDTCYS